MSKFHIVDGTNGVKPSRFYVYIHRRLTDGLVMHVGKGNKRRAWSRSGRNQYWINTGIKHGVRVEIYKDGLSEQCALTLEKIAIYHYRLLGHPLTNMTDGGEGITGLRHSDETKRIISERSRMQVRTEKQLSALRVNDGKPLSKRHREKLSAAKKREKAPTFDIRDHVFYHSAHGKFIGKQYDLRVKYGLSSDGLSHLISGRFKTCKGWTYMGLCDKKITSKEVLS